MGIWIDIWKHRNEILHDSAGVDRISTREINNNIIQEWQNGDTNLLAQDKALIQGTILPQLIQTSQEHKLAWLAQIRLVRMALATVQMNNSAGAVDLSQNP
jgi:hypothetical protein